MAKLTFKDTLDSLIKTWPGLSSSVPEEVQTLLPGEDLLSRISRLFAGR